MFSCLFVASFPSDIWTFHPNPLPQTGPHCTLISWSRLASPATACPPWKPASHPQRIFHFTSGNTGTGSTLRRERNTQLPRILPRPRDRRPGAGEWTDLSSPGLAGSPRHLSEVFTLFVSPAAEPLDGLEAWDMSRLKTKFQVSCLYSQGGSGEALCTWMDTRGRDSSARIKGSPGTEADKIERELWEH